METFSHRVRAAWKTSSVCDRLRFVTSIGLLLLTASIIAHQLPQTNYLSAILAAVSFLLALTFVWLDWSDAKPVAKLLGAAVVVLGFSAFIFEHRFFDIARKSAMLEIVEIASQSKCSSTDAREAAVRTCGLSLAAADATQAAYDAFRTAYVPATLGLADQTYDSFVKENKDACAIAAKKMEELCPASFDGLTKASRNKLLR